VNEEALAHWRMLRQIKIVFICSIIGLCDVSNIFQLYFFSYDARSSPFFRKQHHSYVRCKHFPLLYPVDSVVLGFLE